MIMLVVNVQIMPAHQFRAARFPTLQTSPYSPSLWRLIHGIQWPSAAILSNIRTITTAGTTRLAILHELVMRCEREGIPGDVV